MLTQSRIIYLPMKFTLALSVTLIGSTFPSPIQKAMCDMFFKESEQLRQEHPNLEPLISLLDTQLAKFDAGAIARVSDYADLFHVDSNKISSLFALYEQLGLLVPVEMVSCDHCHTLASAAEYKIC